MISRFEKPTFEKCFCSALIPPRRDYAAGLAFWGKNGFWVMCKRFCKKR
jgi:hypothetical protein